jgi:hypothetical protein
MRRSPSRRDDGKEERRRNLRTREAPVFEERAPAVRVSGPLRRDGDAGRPSAPFSPRPAPQQRPSQPATTVNGAGRPGGGVPQRPGPVSHPVRPQYPPPQARPAAEDRRPQEVRRDDRMPAQPYYPFRTSYRPPRSPLPSGGNERTSAGSPGRTTAAAPRSGHMYRRPDEGLQRQGPRLEEQRRPRRDMPSSGGATGADGVATR